MFRKTRNLGVCLIILAGLVLILGVSTHSWTEVTGEVNNTDSFNSPSGGGISTPYSNSLPSLNSWELINYSYELNGKTYNSNFIGFYLPFNNDLINELTSLNGDIKVYIFPLLSYISVIKKGADYRLVGIFLILGIGLLIVRAWLVSLFN